MIIDFLIGFVLQLYNYVGVFVCILKEDSHLLYGVYKGKKLEAIYAILLC